MMPGRFFVEDSNPIIRIAEFQSKNMFLTDVVLKHQFCFNSIIKKVPQAEHIPNIHTFKVHQNDMPYRFN